MQDHLDEPSGLPVPGEGKRGEAGHWGYLLRQAANAHRQRAEHSLADLGLTLPQFSVLTMLAAYPGHSNADLARLALLTPQTMSVIVTNLSKAGLIERRAHAIHGRIQQIELTMLGDAKLRQAKERVYGLEAAMAAGMTAQEQQTVRAWLVRLAQLNSE